MRESRCKHWKTTLGFTGCFVVDCNGKSGGLALLRKDPIDVFIKSFSVGHIDCVVRDAERYWRFTGFYGQPDAALRHFSWDLLQRLKGLPEFRDLPWLVGGDFNEICFDSEKLGGIRRAPSKMQAFRDTLDLCELQNLHCHGDLFTWVNRRTPDNIIFERLDRYVGNLNWRLLYPAAQATSLDFYHSDHQPLSLQLNGVQSHYRERGQKKQELFRLEKYWLGEDDCEEIVQEGWGTHADSMTVQELLLSCKNAIQSWSNARFNCIPKKLKEKRTQLHNLRTSWSWGSSNAQIQDLEAEVEKLATQDDLYWRQRSLENCSARTLQTWWEFLWGLSIPPKVRIFWWHISHDIIPTNLNLLRHHVPSYGACMLCLNTHDTTCHSLFFCEPSQNIWKGTDFYHVMRLAKKCSTIDFCEWMRHNLSKGEFEKFAIQTWTIWKERQNLIHDTSRLKMVDDVSWSLTLLTDFQKSKALDHQAVTAQRVHAEKRWKQPVTGTFKLNVDACINENSNQYSIDGVLRDCQGRLLLAFGKQISQPISIVHGELLAIREGVKLIYEKNFQEVQVASDSVLAVQAVKALQEDLGYTGVCADDIHLLVKAPVISDIVYEPRSTNKVAHNVANFASFSPSPFVWLNGGFPSWLVEFVMNDLS